MLLLSLLAYFKVSLDLSFAAGCISSCIILYECCFQEFLPCIYCYQLFGFPLFLYRLRVFKKNPHSAFLLTIECASEKCCSLSV